MAMNGQEVLRRKQSGGQNGNNLIIMFAESRYDSDRKSSAVRGRWRKRAVSLLGQL